jgi:hypothetical protein
MKTVIVPIPVDADIAAMVKAGAKATGLKKADVMRQGLRLGVPALVQRLTAPVATGRPQCLDFLDDYPQSSVAAKDVKKALKEKMAEKYGRGNR